MLDGDWSSDVCSSDLDRRQIEFLDRLRCTLGERGRNGCQRYKAGGSTRAGAGKMAAHGG
jgi:hypothetical protein